VCTEKNLFPTLQYVTPDKCKIALCQLYKEKIIQSLIFCTIYLLSNSLQINGNTFPRRYMLVARREEENLTFR
jgi:hypothetical protein